MLRPVSLVQQRWNCGEWRPARTAKKLALVATGSLPVGRCYRLAARSYDGPPSAVSFMGHPEFVSWSVTTNEWRNYTVKRHGNGLRLVQRSTCQV